jgi:hypothetical protein
MPLHIKDDAATQAVRKLARVRILSLTETVSVACEKALERDDRARLRQRWAAITTAWGGGRVLQACSRCWVSYAGRGSSVTAAGARRREEAGALALVGHLEALTAIKMV